MTQFSSGLLFEVYREAGEWARVFTDDRLPPPLIANGIRWVGVDAAVYVGIDAHLEISYVGSVSREASGLRDRIREHLRTDRGRTWVSVAIVPLKSSTPLTQVRTIEGIAIRLLSPHATFRAPSPRRILAVPSPTATHPSAP